MTVLKLALRSLRKSPIFTVAAVVSLTLGIGGNTAVFSLLNGILLRLPTVREPRRLVSIYFSSDKSAYDTSSYPDYVDYRQQNRALQDLVAYGTVPVTISGGTDSSQNGIGELVSPNYFPALGVKVVRGRPLEPDADEVNRRAATIVISQCYWQTALSGDPQVLGRTLKINGQSYTVIGVAHADFRGMSAPFVTDVWLPISEQPKIYPEASLVDRNSRWLSLIGRLKPEKRLEQARANLEAISAQLAMSYPDSNRTPRITAEHLSMINPGFRGSVSNVIVLLFGLVGLVLAIACANVAGLLLARSVTKGKEVAIRRGLGASHLDLARNMVSETLVVAVVGGLLGLVLVRWLMGLVVNLGLPVPAFGNFDVHPDYRVFVFSLFLSMITGILLGLVPLRQASKADLASALKSAMSSSAGRNYARRALIAGQIALSLLLLIYAGLFLHSLVNAASIAPGFRTDNIVLLTLDPSRAGYDEPRCRSLYQLLMDRVRALPGTVSVSLANHIPLELSSSSLNVFREGEAMVPGVHTPRVSFNVVSPDHFQTLGIDLRKGRDFNSYDRAQGQHVAIINETMAKSLFSADAAIGKRFRIGEGTPGRDWYEVIGIVRDTKYITLGESSRPFFYLPFSQHFVRPVNVIVRTTGNLAIVIGALRAQATALDARLPIGRIETMDQHMQSALLLPKAAASVFGSFSALSLIMAVVGLYGLVAYLTEQRTREIAIRMALGATGRQILVLTMREGVQLIGIGSVMGVALALAARRALSSFLYGIGSTDPVAFPSAVAILVAIGLCACLVPAGRAAKLNPWTALRLE